MLVDSGDWRNDGEHVLQYLRQHDITRIDHLVTSHADADHIGGHAAVIDYYETKANGIGAVYDPGIASSSETYQRYLDTVEKHDVTLYKTLAGDQINFGSVDVTVLGPPKQYLANKERNDNSIVLKVTYGKTSLLLPGDAAQQEEEYLVERYGSTLDATVLSAGHHGSKSSTGNALLDRVEPRIAVISSAYNSQYGHPDEETLERFAAHNVQTYWTAVHGNIVLVSDGQDVTVKTQSDAPTDPLSLRDAPPVEPGSTKPVAPRTTIGTKTTRDTEETTRATTTHSQQSPSFRLSTIHADASGNDNENLNDEYLVFENTGTQTLDLTGWTLKDEAGHSYTIPKGVTLAPGDQVKIRTGSGTDTATDLYWNSNQAVWNNGGDTVIVLDDAGETILRETY
ncbi:lamin tail domain-containing protein [Haladaptatus sp. NG-WS-4]